MKKQDKKIKEIRELKRYNLVFYGKVSKGKQVDDVKKNVGTFFKIDGRNVERLFNGSKIVFLKNLDQFMARKCKYVFEKRTGAICSLELIENADSSGITEKTGLKLKSVPVQKMERFHNEDAQLSSLVRALNSAQYCSERKEIVKSLMETPDVSMAKYFISSLRGGHGTYIDFLSLKTTVMVSLIKIGPACIDEIVPFLLEDNVHIQQMVLNVLNSFHWKPDNFTEKAHYLIAEKEVLSAQETSSLVDEFILIPIKKKRIQKKLIETILQLRMIINSNNEDAIAEANNLLNRIERYHHIW